MASLAASSVLFLVLVVFTAGANAATFTITNRCGFNVWPAGIPVGGGRQLSPGQTWTLNVPAGTSSGRIWGRTGCSFNGNSGSCQTGDCGGALSCTLSGRPPATLAEYTIGGATDFYDISVIDGFNLAMDFSCSTGVALRCRDSNCPDAYHQPNDVKTHACSGNSNYQAEGKTTSCQTNISFILKGILSTPRWPCPNCCSASSSSAAMHGSLSIRTCTRILWPCCWSPSASASTSTMGTYPFGTSPPGQAAYHAGTVAATAPCSFFTDPHEAAI